MAERRTNTTRRRITILGQNIRIVRPERPRNPIIYKSDLPVAKYDTKPRNHELGCAEFLRICMTHEMVRED